jgi:hypothetical protein
MITMKTIPSSSLTHSCLFSIFDTALRTEQCLNREALRPIQLPAELPVSILQYHGFSLRFINE